jgi:hypothetical protein
MPRSEFIQLLRNGKTASVYTEITFRAVDFLLELKQERYRYDGDRQSRRYHDCMVLVISALLIGPDIRALATFTGISEPFIVRVSNRMHKAGLWKSKQDEIEEWTEPNGGFNLSTLFAHACVAEGTVGREICSDGEISYWDWI